jgi:thiol-disulfide isomerase/thioredoxin
MVASFARFVGRIGGILVRPRATLASLEPDEGLRDGLWLGLLFVVGGHVIPMLEGVATLVAVRNWGGVLGLVSAVGMVLLAPIVASIVAETILGPDRRGRSGLCIAPLLVLMLLAHGTQRLGIIIPGPSWLPAIVGLVASAGLASWLRGESRSDLARGPRRRDRILGGLVIASAVSIGAADLHRGVSGWSQLGPLPPGERVADFRILTLDGEVLRAEALEGRVSVVTFWATWCGACVSELPDLDALARRYADERGVQFIAVNLEGGGLTLPQTVALVRGFARERDLITLPFAVDDGTMARAFRVGPIPHTVVFDTTGVVRHVHQGRVGTSTLENEIDALLERGP